LQNLQEFKHLFSNTVNTVWVSASTACIYKLLHKTDCGHVQIST